MATFLSYGALILAGLLIIQLIGFLTWVTIAGYFADKADTAQLLSMHREGVALAREDYRQRRADHLRTAMHLRNRMRSESFSKLPPLTQSMLRKDYFRHRINARVLGRRGP